MFSYRAFGGMLVMVVSGGVAIASIAQDLEAAKKALNLIAEFSDSMCAKPKQSGSSSSVDLELRMGLAASGAAQATAVARAVDNAAVSSGTVSRVVGGIAFVAQPPSSAIAATNNVMHLRSISGPSTPLH